LTRTRMGGGKSKPSREVKVFRKEAGFNDEPPKPGVVPDPEPAVETPRPTRLRRGSMPLTQEEVYHARYLMGSSAGTANARLMQRDAYAEKGEAPAGQGDSKKVSQHAVTTMALPLRKTMTPEEAEEEAKLQELRKKRQLRRASIAAAEKEAAGKQYCMKCRFLIPDGCICLRQKEREKKRQEDLEFQRILAKHVVPVVHDNRTLEKYAKEIEDSFEYKTELDLFGGKKVLDPIAREKKEQRRRELEDLTVVDAYIDAIGGAISGKRNKHIAQTLHLAVHKMN